MKTRNGRFLLFGLIVCFLLVGGVYMLSTAHQSITVAPGSSAEVPQTPNANSLPEEGSSTPIKETAPPSHPRTSPPSTPTYQYNGQGQLQTILYPDGSTYTYQYDPDGNKIRETSR